MKRGRIRRGEPVVANRAFWAAVLPWVWRILIGIAILAAPIITFRAFNDPDEPDPAREQKLREAGQYSRPSPRPPQNGEPPELRP
jgi:hypothetical protein